MNSGCTVYSMHLIGCLNINQEVDPYPVSKLFLFILGVSTGLSGVIEIKEREILPSWYKHNI